MSQQDIDKVLMQEAYKQALKSYDEGGVPIGSLMSEGEKVISLGHNKRVQDSDPIAHAEMDCLRNAGRRPNYKGMTLYTTLAPCMMCSGTIVQFGIKRVVIAENANFEGNIEFLQSHGVEVVLLDDTKSRLLMKKFIEEKPELWYEDIAEG